MRATPRLHKQVFRRAERGAILIIMLVMLVLITLVTVSTVRTSTMDERMAGNARDRNKALQAAEAAISKCIADLQVGTYPTGKILTPAAAGVPPVWKVEATWAASAQKVTIPDGGLANDPECLAEKFGASTSFRVTGRAVGGSADTVVILQATYTEE